MTDKEDFNLTNIVQESDERSECKFTDDELIKMDLSNKEDLVQEDFSSCGCVDKGHDWEDKPIPKTENTDPVEILRNTKNLGVVDFRTIGALETLKRTHDEYISAKYHLYAERSAFFTNPENYVKCKEDVGKNTDAIFREYANEYLLEFKEAREVAEFDYKQAKRVFESL
jgi:hypothetical protein